MKLKNFIPGLLLIISVLSGCTSYLDNPEQVWGDDFVEVGSGNLSGDNPEIVISDPESDFAGTRIFLLDNAPGPSNYLTIEEGSLPDTTFSDYMITESKMLRISNGDIYSTNTIFVEIPIFLFEDDIPVVFSYQENTGHLHPMAIVSYDNDQLTFALRETTQVKHESEMKSSGPSIIDHVNILVGYVSLYDLNTFGVVKSGFTPGIDDWEFNNQGNAADTLGTCSGHCLSALFYYDYKTWGGQFGLTNLLDRDPEIWQDNPLGIRLTNEVQSNYDQIAGDKVFRDFLAVHPNSEQDYELWINWYHKMALETIGAQILVSGFPVYSGIYEKTGLQNGHAVIITGVDIPGSRLLIADPNYPGQTRSAAIKADGYFDYHSSPLADAEDNVNYARFMCLGYSGIDYPKGIADFWRQVFNHTIGDQNFPSTDYRCVFNPGSSSETQTMIGQVDKNWLNSISFSPDDKKIKLVCDVVDQSNNPLSTRIWVWKGSDWIGKSIQGKNYIDLDIEKHDLENATLGLYVSQEIPRGNNYDLYWVDFKWINIIQIKIVPEELKGDKNIEYSWEVQLGDQPDNTRFEWNFGDGTDPVVKKNDNYAKHTFAQNGDFKIRVDAFNDDSGNLLGTASGTAKIGFVPELNLVISDAGTGEIIDNETSICGEKKFEFSTNAGYEREYTIKYHLGIEGEPVGSSSMHPLTVYRYYPAKGQYTITAQLIDDSNSVVDEITRELIIYENDFLEEVNKFTVVDGYWDGGSNHYLADGATESLLFFAVPIDREEVISWTGRSFRYYEKRENTELTIEGTLSSTCWIMESFSASYTSRNYEWSFEVTDIPMVEGGCSVYDRVGYAVGGEDLKVRFKGSGRVYDSIDKEWISYSHTDFDEALFVVNFLNYTPLK